MGHCSQGPVGDDTSDSLHTVGVRLDDQVFSSGGIVELDVWHGQKLGHDSRSEEGCVLDNDVAAFVLKGHTELLEELVGWLADDHGREELTSQPSTATWGNSSLEDGDVQVWAVLGQMVGTAQTC